MHYRFLAKSGCSREMLTFLHFDRFCQIFSLPIYLLENNNKFFFFRGGGFCAVFQNLYFQLFSKTIEQAPTSKNAQDYIQRTWKSRKRSKRTTATITHVQALADLLSCVK